MNKTMQAIIDRIDEIPTISGNTLTILNLVYSKDSNIKDISRLISLDVALTTRCLRLVNSAHFGLCSKITNIDHAVNYIGKQGLLCIVIENDFSNVFSMPLGGYSAEEGALWEHSLRTAIAARLVAIENSDNSISDLAYTGGLLNNIGKVIITDFLLKKSKLLLSAISGEEIKDFKKLEEKLLETNHAEVGQKIAEKWNFPEPLQIIIQYHHSPGDAPAEYGKLCYFVHIGDILAMLGGCGTGIDNLACTFDESAKQYIDIKPAMMDRLLFDINEEFEKAKETISNS